MKNQKINSPNKVRAPVFYQKNENEKNESSSPDSKDSFDKKANSAFSFRNK